MRKPGRAVVLRGTLVAEPAELEYLGVAEEGRQGAGKTTRYRLLERAPRRDVVLGLLSPEQLRVVVR